MLNFAIAAILATGLQSAEIQRAEPVTADCTLVGRVVEQTVEAIGLRCPTDVEQADFLQRYALTVSAQIPMPIDLDALGSLNQDPVTFTLTEAGWRLLEPALLVRGRADFPHAAGRRATNARCDARVEVSATGMPESHELHCEARQLGTDRVRPATLFIPVAEDAIANSRWFPPLEAANRCGQQDVKFITRDWPPSWMREPVTDAPRCGAE